LIIIGVFQYLREKKFKNDILEARLENITNITHKYIEKFKIIDNRNFKLIDSLKSFVIDENTRITIISKNGVVLYDSFINNIKTLGNFNKRPEILISKRQGIGSIIRRSVSTGEEYYFFVKKNKDYYVRSAILVSTSLFSFFKTYQFLFYFLLSIFILILGLLWLVTKQFSLSISGLKDFALNAVDNKEIDNEFDFPNNEIGVIGKQIVDIYSNLRSTQKDLVIEKERLFRHLLVINEGVAIFNKDKKKILSNKNFVQYLSLISKEPIGKNTNFFKLKAFKKIDEFINDKIIIRKKSADGRTVEKEFKIDIGNKYFNVKCIIFFDKSFEIIITDLTKREKSRIIKSQMTSNIAHELKTPVSAIYGFLETVLQNNKIDKVKTKYFIKRAFVQVERLGFLINDLTTIDKLENAVDFFGIEKINLHKLVNEIKVNTDFRRSYNNILFKNLLDKNIIVKGNFGLLYSIFQNLVENSMNYAGNDITIYIKKYYEDDSFYYFSFSNTGFGIPEEHLNRIFERFYRIDSGRARKDGGTGLGLSIVKNAVTFHKGEISAKNISGGGVEFLFTIKKL